MNAPAHSILVTGDLVLDHHVYEGRRHHFADELHPGVRWKPQPGGAALVHELLVKLTEPSKNEWGSYSAVKLPQSDDECHKVDESQRAYAFWRPFPRTGPPEKQYWRVSEPMGFGSACSAPCATWAPADAPKCPEIIVLSEGGMGFRKTECCWGHLPFDTARWVVLKTAAPIAEGLLWSRLAKSDVCSKLIVIVAASELRKTAARLSCGLTWDESLESLLNALQPNEALSALRVCRHLIVTFESEGAVWIDLGDTAAERQAPRAVHFMYEPSAIEGDHAQEVGEGTAFGFLSCMTAAVVWQLTENIETPDLESACERGLCTMRDLRVKGHGPFLEVADGFPVNRLAKAIQSPAWRYSRARFSFNLNDGAASGWSLMRESLLTPGPAYDLARLTALRGPIALENVPHLKIGKLLTVDRHEIETLRQLVQLIRRYDLHDPGKKPLSIGVFGPPGAGKSFAVKEIASKLSGPDSWLEFNLSQFANADDLIGAFHQIRDKVLQCRLPVVFFDEFDSQSYRWLQFLLAPMQDGKFQEGQVTHPIGKCVFIFAGGTSWTYETFGPPPSSATTGGSSSSTTGGVGHLSAAEMEFRLAKGPDFKSRLDAYLDVVGPNQRQMATIRANRYDFRPDPTDIFFPIRRALMLRSELKCEIDAKLDMDEGVLHALLHTESYAHGSRSLTKLLQPFMTPAAGRLVRSLLPPQAQIAMHTDAEQFLELCQSAPQRALTPATESGSAPLLPGDVMDESPIQTLAPAIHGVYQTLGMKAGWLKAETPYNTLDEFDQGSNQAAARRMIRILDLVGLQLVDGQNTATELSTLGQLIEYRLELMAEAEHDGWMKWHFEQGWRYADLPAAKPKDKLQKLHRCLIPYRQLKQFDQEKDRESIRHYLEFAALAGKKMVIR